MSRYLEQEFNSTLERSLSAPVNQGKPLNSTVRRQMLDNYYAGACGYLNVLRRAHSEGASQNELYDIAESLEEEIQEASRGVLSRSGMDPAGFMSGQSSGRPDQLEKLEKLKREITELTGILEELSGLPGNNERSRPTMADLFYPFGDADSPADPSGFLEFLRESQRVNRGAQSEPMAYRVHPATGLRIVDTSDGIEAMKPGETVIVPSMLPGGPMSIVTRDTSGRYSSRTMGANPESDPKPLRVYNDGSVRPDPEIYGESVAEQVERTDPGRDSQSDA